MDDARPRCEDCGGEVKYGTRRDRCMECAKMVCTACMTKHQPAKRPKRGRYV